MARSLQELLREASQLPENDRAELAGRLIQSLEGPPDQDVEAAWADEIERRIREIDEGKVSCRPVEQVVQDIHNKLHARRQPS